MICSSKNGNYFGPLPPDALFSTPRKLRETRNILLFSGINSGNREGMWDA